MVKKAIIPAAGYGTRNLPITKVLPKEMLPICGRPAIDYLVEEAISSGIEQILIIVSRSKNMILDYFDRSPELEAHLKAKNKDSLSPELLIPNIHIQYVRQPNANGLGDAILLGRNFVGNEPFAVMLPDEIILSDQQAPLLQLIETFKKCKGNAIGLKAMNLSELKKYGVVKPQFLQDKLYQLKHIVEKPQNEAPSNLAVIGRYVFDPKIFDYLTGVQPGVEGEIQLTDAINAMIPQSNSYGLEIEGQRFDIANTSDYIKLINLIYSKGNSVNLLED
ncbi:UTP--glucose-1-phosphate uridylyltransferase [Peribacillus deserti]|uniref:UTP--glucose-1-phosphate uridylyltransferase n=1 Tax=Peribacillus deserti TaxID=673318 RepID=A0A2N5M0F3_9BACI|nr:UTP--glucose-1-phosphate uridylyltransferase [Peribacillus deserti]PLT27795.1 UTP--glucose-1-phosphate uridylyltransferase [Peribacillus deserti]